MSEFNESVEQLRVAMLRLRPVVRPYFLAAMWFVLVLSIAWDVKRYLGGHPRGIVPAATFYLGMIGALIFDYWVERRLRRETREKEELHRDD